jgi:hypothetical protein
MSTTFTVEMVEALRKAISKGVKSVTYQDKTITYHSMDEMLRALRLMEQELGLKKKNGRLFAESSKGIC